METEILSQTTTSRTLTPRLDRPAVLDPAFPRKQSPALASRRIPVARLSREDRRELRHAELHGWMRATHQPIPQWIPPEARAKPSFARELYAQDNAEPLAAAVLVAASCLGLVAHVVTAFSWLRY